jgi:hypothetical protein
MEIARSLATVFALLFPVLILADATPAPQAKAADFFKPREQLESFEVYHLSDHMEYYSDITLDALISSKPAPRDYVRIGNENRYAVDALYSELSDTILFLHTPCETRRLDVRWAIVLNYDDHTRAALGFNRLAHCLQFSTHREPIAATAGMVEFVDRTFGFMR